MYGKLRTAFLSILLLALAGAAQADTVFPVGWTLTYAAEQGVNDWVSELTFTSPTTLKLINWESATPKVDEAPVILTDTALSIDEGHGPQLYFDKTKNVGVPWDFKSDDGSTGTATVKAILNSFEVPAGTFDNVYQVYYLTKVGENIHMNENFYWLPGLGLLRNEDYGKDPDSFHTLTAYATPIPPGFLLFGSGLLGLAVLRRVRKG